MHLSAQQIQSIIDYQYHSQASEGLTKAAVSIMLRNGESGVELLLMQRAKHQRDPWSGQMAFPGGKVEQNDASPLAAAQRETLEEVGVALQQQEKIAQLDDVYGLATSHKRNVHVSCFVFWLDRQLELKGNYEVADLLWVPLAFLAAPENRYQIQHPLDPTVSWPAVMINQEKQQILWGLSLRMLANLSEILKIEHYQLFNQLAIPTMPDQV